MAEIDDDPEEVARTRRSQAEYADAEAQRQATVKARNDIIRQRAHEDPAFRALVEHLGIALEDA